MLHAEDEATCGSALRRAPSITLRAASPFRGRTGIDSPARSRFLRHHVPRRQSALRPAENAPACELNTGHALLREAGLEPLVGIEPTTGSLQNCYSTTELQRPSPLRQVRQADRFSASVQTQNAQRIGGCAGASKDFNALIGSPTPVIVSARFQWARERGMLAFRGFSAAEGPHHPVRDGAGRQSSGQRFPG